MRRWHSSQCLSDDNGLAVGRSEERARAQAEGTVSVGARVKSKAATLKKHKDWCDWNTVSTGDMVDSEGGDMKRVLRDAQALFLI